MTDRPTDRPTVQQADVRGHWEVTLQIRLDIVYIFILEYVTSKSSAVFLNFRKSLRVRKICENFMSSLRRKTRSH